MRLEKHSNNFTPLQEGILFGIDTESDTPTDVLVEIVDDSTDKVIAVQQLRGIVTGEVNIAPYIPVLAEYTPTAESHTHFCDAPVATYRIRVGEVTSEPISVSVNRESVSVLPTLLSAMPRLRSISLGETDELLLLGDKGANYEVTITADTGEALYYDYLSSAGTAILRISTEDFGTDFHSLEVDLYCDGVSLGLLHYRLRPHYNSSARVAWLSRKGSIEHYSFPVKSKAHLTSQKSCIETLEGKRIVAASSECEMTLVSRYEPRETIQAISEMVCSSKVWLETDDGWAEVVVTSTNVDYNLFGEPDSLRVNLCRWSGKEGEL